MDRSLETQINLLHPLVLLEWKECSEMPLGMSDAQAVLLGDKVYVGGGDSTGTYYGSPAVLLVYECSDDSWNLLSTPTVNYALTTCNSQLVLVGGRDPMTESITNQLWALDEQWHWTQSLPPMTTRRSRASAMNVDHYLIVAGGLDDELDPLDVVEVYDDYYWRKVQSIPKASCSMKSCLLKGIWYLAGGDEQGTEIIYTSLYSLIATTSSEMVRQTSVWKKLPNVPLEWSTPVIIEKQLVTVGGYSHSSAMYVYTHSKTSWVCAEDLPFACHSTCTLVLPTGELLVVGGGTLAKHEILCHVFKAKIKMTSFPDGCLAMSAFECLEAIAGISIYNQLAPKYLTMAAALHLDQSTLNGLRAENNPVEGTKTMFKAWLSGESSMPPTWKILLKKLDNMQMGELGQEITSFFDKTLVTSPSASLISESKKEELDADVSDIEKKELQTRPDCTDIAVQIRPDCQEAAVQNSPDIQEMAVQTQSEATNAEMTGYIRGVEVIGETKFTVTTRGGSFEWKGYGLKLHVPEGSLPAEVGECRINIRASLLGQFQFPEDSDLLSPVFWLSVPCEFTKPVTLEVQHCALREDDATFSFVSARCSQKELPYNFRRVDGGVFTTHSSYGSIQLSHFSGFGITGRKRTPRSYCAHLYHTMKQMYDWRYYFVLTQDLEAKNTVVRDHYSHFATEEATLQIEFEDSEITLDIPVDGQVTREGWRITPRSYPTIFRKDADQFKPGQRIPECQLIVQWEREDQRPVRLRRKVDLIGAKAPYNFFQLTLNPALEEESKSSSGGCGSVKAPTPEMKDLMDALYHTVADKWEFIGIYLHLPMATMKAITTEHQRDPHKCLIGMLEVWLKRMHPPPTWSAVVEAVEFLGEEQLGRELRAKYILPMQ